jgi:hypothetical protein
MKWYTQERDPEGLRRVVRNGQVPAWRSPVVWDAGSAGASGQRPAVYEHGERVPVGEPDPVAVPVSLAESRGGAAGAASARAVDGGPPPGARDAARGGTLWDFVGDEHRAADGSMRYA